MTPGRYSLDLDEQPAELFSPEACSVPRARGTEVGGKIIKPEKARWTISTADCRFLEVYSVRRLGQRHGAWWGTGSGSS